VPPDDTHVHLGEERRGDKQGEGLMKREAGEGEEREGGRMRVGEMAPCSPFP
jgi:hypothetical protein